MGTTASTSGKSGGNTFTYACVLCSGIATAALALLLGYLANEYAHINLIGFHVDYVLPAGAIFVGILAGSGYGLASWIAGVKIRRGLLWAVMFFQCVAYVSAEYIAFEQLHLVHVATQQPVGFLEYIDFTTRTFAFKGSNGEPGNPMGVWGYAFRFLEMAGFAFAGMAIPAFVQAVPYCESCRRYMRRKNFAVLAACVSPRKIDAKDAQDLAAYQEENRQANESALKALQVLGEMAGNGQMNAVNDALAALRPRTKIATKLRVRYKLSLFSCPACASGQLNAVPLTGHGKEMKRGAVMIFPIHPEESRETTAV